MTKFETTFILEPGFDEGRINEEIDRVTGWIKDLGGEVLEVQRWGKKRLAYEIGLGLRRQAADRLVGVQVGGEGVALGRRGDHVLDRAGVMPEHGVEDAQHGRGLLIIAHDEGPPFHDLSLALRDGWNDRGPIDPVALFKRGGLGAGLGAIVRLTDSFEVRSRPKGKEIRVVRYRISIARIIGGGRTVERWIGGPLNGGTAEFAPSRRAMRSDRSTVPPFHRSTVPPHQ